MTKYGFIRKAGKGKWRVCYLDAPNTPVFTLAPAQVRFLKNRDEVERQMNAVKANSPDCKYAILEFEV